MSDDLSPRLSLPYLAAGQAQKEVLHNEALQMLDLLVQPVVSSATSPNPPDMPAVGCCWIVAAGATGAWAGREGAIAQWTMGGWRFAAPLAGWRCHVLDQQVMLRFDGMVWRAEGMRDDGVYVAGQRVVAARQPSVAAPAGGTTVDTESRSAIAAILTILRAHGLIAI